MVASVFGLVLLLNANAFGLGEDTLERGAVVVVPAIVVHLGYSIVCLLKGELATGLIGLVVPVLGLVGAIRLAHPSSFWPRRFYREHKTDEASRRHERMTRRRERLRDLFSGSRDQLSSPR